MTLCPCCRNPVESMGIACLRVFLGFPVGNKSGWRSVQSLDVITQTELGTLALIYLGVRVPCKN